MKLQVKFSLIFLLGFGIGLGLAGYVCFGFLQKSARDQVASQARLMMESSLATRIYTTEQIKPMVDRNDPVFHPQTVPAYAATEHFNYFRKANPDYTYKEATLNPTNPRDRAMDWEADVVNIFRNDPTKQNFSGERDTPKGRALYIARPIKAVPPCLECHSIPRAAPASMLKIYGRTNGFGWQPDEIIGAQIVSVPMALPVAMANKSFRQLMTSLIAVGFCVLLVLNLMLYLFVIRPVGRFAVAADEISKGNLEIPELPAEGRDEIATLARSFNRMHRSLVKAMRMLDRH
jgi:HAMP domain-containing protein